MKKEHLYAQGGGRGGYDKTKRLAGSGMSIEQTPKIKPVSAMIEPTALPSASIGSTEPIAIPNAEASTNDTPIAGCDLTVESEADTKNPGAFHL